MYSSKNRFATNTTKKQVVVEKIQIDKYKEDTKISNETLATPFLQIEQILEKMAIPNNQR